MSALRNIPRINVLCMEARYITALDKALTKHWASHASTPKLDITTINHRLSAVPSSTKFQLVVSPANSYGRLDGAFDDAISTAFCLPHHPYDTLTVAVQKSLYEKYRGFAPPGTCTLVPFPAELQGMNDWGCKWVAICPTMRVPANVTWDREVIYECVWSLLVELERWNRGTERDRIESILITPLATGVGRVSPDKWAAQFVLALKHFVDALERPERWSRLDWGDVAKESVEVQITWGM